MLTQKEADALCALEKHRIDDTVHSYPGPGSEIRIPLISADQRESFILDLRRHRIILTTAGKYQTRGRTDQPLIRVCFARPHRNPDGAEIPREHIHVYREGYGLDWAYPLGHEFSDPADRIRLLDDFMRYCRVTRPPIIQQDAFA